jgi:hypothetical protein
MRHTNYKNHRIVLYKLFKLPTLVSTLSPLLFLLLLLLLHNWSRSIAKRKVHEKKMVSGGEEE